MNILLRPQRDLDIKGASLLQQKVYSLMPIPEQSILAVDLVQVERIDHFGLTTLMAVRRVAEKYRCQLYLTNLRLEVSYMLEVAELADEFKLLDSLDGVFESKLRVLLC
ncbi:MAG: STAS domain-containing protein [Spirulinaceae cyanobacterium RM2_2_10]|nr:STAS domain-containing protein [Spirulinaceae cyanobacterium SM2_1_0]NJO21352.1 STAS domain-containing protein [Spirulinaceae cyanobacterium RM2_2_10]